MTLLTFRATHFRCKRCPSSVCMLFAIEGTAEFVYRCAFCNNTDHREMRIRCEMISDIPINDEGITWQ